MATSGSQERALRTCGFAGADVSYDPRFLLFEFTCNMMLRQSQVQLVQRFVTAHSSDKSLCHQLIMGAGKTTGSQRSFLTATCRH
eukprot:3219647-Rhodomonas_salina.1